MNDELRRIELLPEFSGIEAIALVEMPAIDEGFLLFSDETKHYSFVKTEKEKRIITGPAMIPDKDILRYDPWTNEYFNIWFSKETVESVAHNYLLFHKQDNTNLDHKHPVVDVSVVESWIVENPETDKAKELGYVVNEGTWMVSMKVNDDFIWEKIIKAGAVKGFSIEGWFIEEFSKQLKNNKLSDYYDEDEDEDEDEDRVKILEEKLQEDEQRINEISNILEKEGITEDEMWEEIEKVLNKEK